MLIEAPNKNEAIFKECLVCSYTVKDDYELEKNGYIFVGVLHIVKQEIHVWGRPNNKGE